MKTELPFLPLCRPEIDEATIAGVAEVLRSGWLTGGPMVQRFEAALSEYFGRPTRTVASGTAGLEIALLLAGVGPGDEVITTPMSWVATGNVILRVGARPVFVDIDPATRNIDLSRVPAAITERTRCLLPVDLAGLPVDREKLYAIAKHDGLRVVEDAAQSMGANWQGVEIGRQGDLCSFSFHANKNLTTGEGGCVVLNHEQEAAQFALWRLQGLQRLPDGEMECDFAGLKANMTDIAARLGLGQLPHLAEITRKRRQLARAYFDCLPTGLGLGLPPFDLTQSNWHMFQVQLPLSQLRLSRGEFMAALKAAGIGSGVHYPAMHLFSVYRRLGYREGDFPVAEALGQTTLSLPMFVAMERSDVERVCHTLGKMLQEYGQ